MSRNDRISHLEESVERLERVVGVEGDDCNLFQMLADVLTRVAALEERVASSGEASTSGAFESSKM